jgi:hypothetical protein
MFWWEEALAAHRVAWSSEMLGPFITIDFGSTVNVKSRTVWADSTPASGEGNEPYHAPVGGSMFAAPAKLNWSRPAQTFSGPNLIGDSVDVKFTQVPGDGATARRASFDGSTRSIALQPGTGLLVSGVLIALGLFGRKRVNHPQNYEWVRTVPEKARPR